MTDEIQPVTPDERPFDLLGFMIDWENGELSDEDEIRLFAHLIKTGMAWQLQGCYGRRAADLLKYAWATGEIVSPACLAGGE
jgi:hypothetical protein